MVVAALAAVLWQRSRLEGIAPLGHHMDVRPVGTWFAILAIALQAAWPLIAAAKPRSVALVPLCTVDGVTHYLEVPTGKTPLDGAAHQDHCAFCFLGVGGLIARSTEVPIPVAVPSERSPVAADGAIASSPVSIPGARAPPFLLSVTDDPSHRGNDETAFAFGRHDTGANIADPGVRVLRLGVLHR